MITNLNSFRFHIIQIKKTINPTCRSSLEIQYFKWKCITSMIIIKYNIRIYLRHFAEIELSPFIDQNICPMINIPNLTGTKSSMIHLVQLTFESMTIITQIVGSLLRHSLNRSSLHIIPLIPEKPHDQYHTELTNERSKSKWTDK